MNKDEKPKQINNKEDLDHLVNQINDGSYFALEFSFKEYQIFQQLLERLEIDCEVFYKSNFYFDSSRNLHISESEFNRFWISTIGLVAGGNRTTDKFVNSCITQYTVVSLLIDKSLEVSNKPKIYDINSYNFRLLSQLNQALFHNLLFYFELFGKAYLSLSNKKVPKTHRLRKIFDQVEKTLFEKNHNNSFFHARMIAPILLTVNYINTIPGDFKEEYIKYEDNLNNETSIVFNSPWFSELKDTIELCNEFVIDYYYNKDDCFQLTSGFLKRVLKMCKTEEEKRNVKTKYEYLNKHT